MSYLIALAGNQNSGKTTLFNRLSGSNQHVGNFPGVTVEKKEGHLRGINDAIIVDLPGIYSLSPYTNEEVVTRDFLIKDKPDLIINIIDATNIERNLYLSLQLMELDIPMIIALNMIDEVIASGNSIDTYRLALQLNVPIIAISASKNQGIDELIKEVSRVLVNEKAPPKVDFCKGYAHKAIHSISHIIEDYAKRERIPIRFGATKVVEGDELTLNLLKINERDTHIIMHIIEEMEVAIGIDAEAALADARYSFIEEICKKAVFRSHETNEQIRSEKIDRLLTHRYLGIPIFICIMLLIFYCTFSLFGEPLVALMELGIDIVSSSLHQLLSTQNISPVLMDLIFNGILVGVGSVLSFLPLIVTLFFFLSLLEDSGYMARVAFLMDKFLRGVGLSGRSFVPMMIGFGCSVPAIMATRTLASERNRKITIIITPFMSCSAKLPIYAMIISAFFAKKSAFVMILIYCIGIVVAVATASILSQTRFRGASMPFVMELPAYRIPNTKTVIMHMWEKAKDFIKKAFTIIFISSILIWFLRSFNFQWQMVSDSADSILASIGKVIAPIFKPLGFNDWRASSALISGISAKENVVSTLSILMGVSDTESLNMVLKEIFTPLASLSFLIFTVLYMPCIAAFAATKRELGSLKAALKVALLQTGIAYFVAMIIYQIMTIFVG